MNALLLDGFHRFTALVGRYVGRWLDALERGLELAGRAMAEPLNDVPPPVCARWLPHSPHRCRHAVDRARHKRSHPESWKLR